MNIDAGQSRSLQRTDQGEWNKLSKFRREELQELGLVELDEYGSPIITPTGAVALKEGL